MAPIRTNFIKFKKSKLTMNRLLIAIDSGHTLTKVLFLNKNKKDDFLNENVKTLTLEFNLFLNEEFENALEFIKLNAFQVEDHYKVHITGVFALKHRNRVHAILNRDVDFINEHTAVSVGIKFASEHIGIDNMIVKTADEEDFGTIDNPILNQLAENARNIFKEHDDLRSKTSSIYPILFHAHGSGAGCIYFDSDGNSEFHGLMNPGGKTFLGLAKCLLDTNDYNEVVGLANIGNKSEIDTLLREMFIENSDYGKFNLDMPIFPFGKCADYNKGKEDFRKEDIAISLVSLYTHYVIAVCSITCVIKKIPKIHMIGNLFNSDIFQRELIKNAKIFPLGVEYVFLNLGYFGVLGTMLCEEVDKFNFI